MGAMETTIDAQDSSRPVVDVRSVWAGYNGITALEDISFQIPEGDIVGLIGPNGSGKSTLFKVILGLLKPLQGEVLLFGEPPQSQRPKVGYMPQVEMVDWDFPVAVEDVALMGRFKRVGLLRRPSKADRRAANEALERVGMGEFKRRLIGELSGGQRRRVLLARALADDPSLLLLDEPFSGLDATAQHQVLEIVVAIQATGATVLMSTHDISCVSRSCQQAACLSSRLVAYGTPDEVLTEKVLGDTFGTHLLMLQVGGRAHAYQHHTTNGNE